MPEYIHRNRTTSTAIAAPDISRVHLEREENNVITIAVSARRRCWVYVLCKYESVRRVVECCTSADTVLCGSSVRRHSLMLLLRLPVLCSVFIAR